ncbi:MAG: hypothetical protein IT317_13995 [Anaerolineales bacterium]|nr:hypothetical protein [Anaerolineales bacterium]
MALKNNYEPGYPLAASNAAWQKKKSFLDKAKAATKTGLGAQLTAAQQAYARVKFNLLDPEAVAKHIREEHGGELLDDNNKVDVLINQAKNAAYQHQNTVLDAAIDHLSVAEAKAKDTAKNKALTAAAQTAATAIAKDLRKHITALTVIRHDDLDEFNEVGVKLKEEFTRG